MLAFNCRGLLPKQDFGSNIGLDLLIVSVCGQHASAAEPIRGKRYSNIEKITLCPGRADDYPEA
jgi:hypothetical protein